MKYWDKLKEKLGRAIYIPLAIAGLSSYALPQDSPKINYSNPGAKIEISEKQNSLEQLSINSKIESGIFEKVKAEGYARVIVELNYEGFNKDKFKEYKDKLVDKEDRVLSKLSDSFSLRFKYKTIPGFAGKVDVKDLEKLSRDSDVKAVYADRVLHTNLTESIPLINADDTHNIKVNSMGMNGDGQVIAVIDTGVDYTHPDLGGCFGPDCRVIEGYDFVNNDSDPMDDSVDSHGTHIAGIASAKGVINGTAPNAKLLAVKVCDGDGNCDSSAIIAGVDWCIDKKDELGTSVINMSISNDGNYNSSDCPTWMDSSIDRAVSLNLPFVAGAGNSGFKDGISYPACSSNAISVGAVYDANLGGSATICLNSDCTKECTDSTTFADKVACFSNCSSDLDLMAPGVLIKSTVRDNKYDFGAGTSQAAPHVAGTIALMKQANPNMEHDEIVEILKTTGKSVTDSGNGLTFPRIDALAATFCSLEGQSLEGIIQCPKKFIRGDANNDKNIDISDPIKTLFHLYGGLKIDCMDAADSNDDGNIDNSDAIYSLNFIFREGTTLPAPYPKEGYDYNSPDGLKCIY